MTKIRARVGDVEIEYEGPESFLDKKLPDLISRLSKLAEAPATPKPKQQKSAASGEVGSLASFLQQHAAGTNQVKKFLATALWIEAKRGTSKLKTADVAQALRDSHQSRLGNPSDCLNHNVKKGHCEKDGADFFVTEEGRKSLE